MTSYSKNSEGIIYQISWSDTYCCILLGYVFNVPADLQELQKCNLLQRSKRNAY
jgi:hypothetical protein